MRAKSHQQFEPERSEILQTKDTFHSNKNIPRVMNSIDIMETINQNIIGSISWTWDSQNIQSQTIVENNTIHFHPHYSQGTSVVRSSQRLFHNMIHYWEIKIVNWSSGTDLVSFQISSL